MNKADFKGYFKNIQQIQEDVNTDEVWKMTKEHLKLMLGNRVFLSLFNDVYIENIGNGIVQFACDSEFKKEKILRDYKASLRQALKKVTGANYEIEINVQRKVGEKGGYEYHDPTENKTMDLFSESKKEQETLEKNCRSTSKS